ncbi:hypothetical protein ACTI_70090 [Actinoplanes sp. OR16]|nr:hypothetical protein ACTI_70090 [Actinoplanes sp. OR16]
MTGCPGCGRAPDADALEVMRLDAELTALRGDLDRAQAVVVSLQRQITDMTTQRNTVAFRVTESVRATKSAEVRKNPAPTAVLGPGAHPSQGPAASPGLAPSPGPAESKLSALTVQNVLFALGGLLLIVAAAVFTAVAWAQVGVTGRAAILAATTAAVLAVPPFAKRRGLTAAAETLAAVGLLMILLDAYAAWAVDFLQVRSLAPEAYAAAAGAVTAAVAYGYGRLTGLRGPAIAALLICQPVLPLLAASADPGPTAWSLTLTAVTALNVAVLHRSGFAPTGPAVVAYVCGSLAAAVSALIAIVDLVTTAAEATAPEAASSGGATGAAAAGGALVLVTAVVTVAAVLAGNRVAQTIAAGLLTVAVAVAAGTWSLLVGAGPSSSGVPRLATVALIIAALAAVVRPRLPEPVGKGPRTAALLVTAVPALGSAAAVAVGALRTAEAATPLLGAPANARVDGPGWTLIAAVVAVLCSYGILLESRHRTDLALTALAGTALLVPAAFHLPWWTAVPLGLLTAAAALTLIARAATAPWPLFRPIVAALLTAHALVVALGDPAVGATAFTTLALIGFLTSFLVRREHHLLAATSTTIALLAVPAAVSLTLLAFDASPTWQVRAQSVIAVLLLAAARALPWHRPQTTVVALLMSAALPLTALTGDDPVALYAATALLLIATTPLTLRDTTAVAVVAAIVPVTVLLFGLAPELSTVLLKPYTALTTFWSGEAPAAETARWSSLLALLMVTAAAALVGYRSAGPRAALWCGSPVVAVLVPLTFAAFEAPWPSVLLAGLVTGLLGIVALIILPSPMAWTGVVFGALAAAGLAGTTAVQGAMLAGFALVTVAAVVCGVAGRGAAGRVAGWVGAGVGTVVTAYTASRILDLGAGAGPISVLAAAAVVVALEAVLAARRPREAPAVAAVAHASALVALVIAGTLGRAALIATLWAAVLGLRALRPGEIRAVRFRYAIAAAGSALLGWWLLLGSRDVQTPEIYTLPAAAFALGAGWLARRGRPELPSWTAYGPALAVGFLPTLAVIVGDEPEYPRRLLLGLGALAVLLAGARARLRAPVVAGGLMLALTALHELIQVWDFVPRWVPLAVGGLLLVGVATTMEQRRRDLLRLRTAVGRMS